MINFVERIENRGLWRAFDFKHGSEILDQIFPGAISSCVFVV